MTPTTAKSESELLARLRGGEDRAYSEFVRQYTGKMLTLARRFLANEEDAADAVQEAFLSAFKNLKRFEGYSALGTWLYRIVVNTCLMKWRSSARRSMRSLEELLPAFDESGHHARAVASWPENGYQRLALAEIKTQIRECIAQLPESYRAVLLLRDIEELDTDQTAAILGIHAGAVKTRLHRARQALRTLLEPIMMDRFKDAE